ncbi:hypothetical protein [Acidimicrobium ferrooxidans]|nr:hypothetical protein [Acidimicrobium ferrooxidans]
MKGPDVKRVKELSAENRRPKKLVADLALDNDSSEELAEGNV